MTPPTQPPAFTATNLAVLQTRRALPAPVRAAVATPAQAAPPADPIPVRGRYVDMLV